MKMLEIVKKSRDYLVIYKPIGVPSQPDPSGDEDVMTMARKLLRESGEGDALWLVHRLDRTVSGLLVFARTGRAAAELSRMVSDGQMGKSYLAVAEGVPECGVYRDLICKDPRLSKAFVVDRERRGVKSAELRCSPIATVSDRTLCRIDLRTGRFHQIRVQLASRGTPLVGDGKYGSRDKGAKTPALIAYKLDFELFGEHVSVARMPDADAYPWSMFVDHLLRKDQ